MEPEAVGLNRNGMWAFWSPMAWRKRDKSHRGGAALMSSSVALLSKESNRTSCTIVTDAGFVGRASHKQILPWPMHDSQKIAIAWVPPVNGCTLLDFLNRKIPRVTLGALRWLKMSHDQQSTVSMQRASDQEGRVANKEGRECLSPNCVSFWKMQPRIFLTDNLNISLALFLSHYHSFVVTPALTHVCSPTDTWAFVRTHTHTHTLAY